MPEKRENRKGWKRDGRRWEATEKEGCRVCIAEPDAGTKRGEPIYRHAMCSCISQFVFLNVAQVSFSGVSEMKRVMPSEGEANQ